MKVPPNIHEDSYQELVSAQKEYRNQEECPRLEGNEEIGQLANRFLNLGGTSHFLRLNALIFDDTIKNIIACGYGSHLLEELAKFEPNMYTHEYAVAMFVMLCNWDLTPTVIINQQHQNYLDALRTATIALFKHLFRMPYELSQFLVLTRTTEWTTQYRLTIIMWYMEKTEDELVLYTRYWPIVGNFTHLKLWKLCKDEFVDLSHYLRILDLLERTEIYGLRALPQIKPVVDIMGARLTVFHLGKYRIVRELKRYDREVIEALLNDEHWVEQASALNILITRKHYESNINIRQDIRMCGLFSDAYRRICKSDTDISHRVCVITGVFSAESKKKESLMLESTDITAALMEDLMRNKNAKMYTSHRPMNLVGFYSKYELEMGPLYAWQHCKYNPRLIFECATRNHNIFDFFVLVCITSQSIPVAGVILMFDNYKRLVNSNAKFIIIGSDSLAEYEQLGDRQDVILFSGVKSTTYHLVKLYMNL
ncbi:hypothetical protein CRE_17256 [Caenorhabditis remanei]|uniref:Uncharacterized protein n=1 Tax=Caenorhabditis remanei TaxID=31234 RepID=E3MAD9_CAERE|nr:hypothetical protein CRE_17256 [Caenorhabditis remanei]